MKNIKLVGSINLYLIFLKYKYFIIIPLVSVVLAFGGYIYFFHSDSQLKLTIKDNVVIGTSVFKIDKLKDINIQKLFDINQICNIVSCNIKQMDNNKYTFSANSRFLHYSIDTSGILNFVPNLANRSLNLVYNGYIIRQSSAFHPEYPIIFISNMKIIENDKIKSLVIKWELRSSIAHKIIKQVGQSTFSIALKRVQDTYFKSLY